MATTQQVLTTLGTEPITADQLLEMYGKGMRGELIRGVFCPTMPTGMKHGEIVMNLAFLIMDVVKPDKLGRIMGSDSGVKTESNPDTVREPDIAYFSRERLPLDADVPGYAEIAPDLVVEVVSPSDSVREIAGKANMWINAGVQLVWVIWPETQMVEIYRPGQPVATLAENDTLTAENVLPQFNVPVSDVFNT
ncbi:MAG: Uma2 family endonuclease [Dehalococcoidia bacterium]|nr:Uma2 family endonuclease [Dehalococcoidia bacterium]